MELFFIHVSAAVGKLWSSNSDSLHAIVQVKLLCVCEFIKPRKGNEQCVVACNGSWKPEKA